MAIILQYINVSIQYVVYIKLIHCVKYISIKSNNFLKNEWRRKRESVWGEGVKGL